MADLKNRHAPKSDSARQPPSGKRAQRTPLTLSALLVTLSLALWTGCSSPDTPSPDASTTDGPLQGWSTPTSSWERGALAAAWAPADADDTDGWVLVGGDNKSGVILRLEQGQWKSWDIESSPQMWWVHGDPQGNRAAVGADGVLVTWRRGDAQPVITQLPSLAEQGTALYGVWFAPGAKEYWLVGGSPSLGAGSGVLLKVPASALGPEVEKSVQKIPLDATADILFKILGTDDGHIWAVGDSGKIWHTSGGSWELEATIPTDVLIGIAGSSANNLVTVGGRASGVVVRRGLGGWSLVAGGTPNSWISGLSAVLPINDDVAVVAGSYGFVGVQEPSSDPNELSGIEPPLTSMTLHGAYGAAGVQVIVGGTFELTTQPLRGCLLVRGGSLPPLP